MASNIFSAPKFTGLSGVSASNEARSSRFVFVTEDGRRFGIEIDDELAPRIIAELADRLGQISGDTARPAVIVDVSLPREVAENSIATLTLNGGHTLKATLSKAAVETILSGRK